MINWNTSRETMIEHQLRKRGIKDTRVLDAMREVPREAFVSPDLVEFAYEDSPLPIEENQTISQPYIVGLMLQVLDLQPDDVVLEVGTGSGYAAALLSRIVRQVYTIERYGALVESARKVFASLGYTNIQVTQGDGTQGWPEYAPFDKITIAAGGPKIPEALKGQLAINGRLIIPVGEDLRRQRLILLKRESFEHYRQDDLGGVRFVPLIGEEGWESPSRRIVPETSLADDLPGAIARYSESFTSIADCRLDAFLDRVGDSRVVLLGEATHGSAEFYDMRAKMTRALVEEKGFNIVAVEADWPDAALVNAFIHGPALEESSRKGFQRFPAWMWGNVSFKRFMEWMKEYNRSGSRLHKTVHFYGLDLYSMYASIRAVLDYLDAVDPFSAEIARRRYGCLTPWEQDPAAYGAMVVSGRYKDCEEEVAEMLQELVRKQYVYASHDGKRVLDVMQNARLVSDAEKYYRVMYYGARDSWNLRDKHMFDTLLHVMKHHGTSAKAVVWAHNSHIGDASVTEMGARGEFNIGQLCRELFANKAYLVGFGTDHGEVTAASAWDGEAEVKKIRPSRNDSYEYLCHTSGRANFLLPLRHSAHPALREELAKPRLERAIGVIYRPETELQSHYFEASLARQFDEYVWFDRTSAIQPLTGSHLEGVPETFPFGV